MKKIEDYRQFLKAENWSKRAEINSDQKQGYPQPKIQKEYSKDQKLIDLIPQQQLELGEESLKDVIKKRRSRRSYRKEPLSKEELSYLLWSTQGIKEDNPNLRTVPSGGARHPFETYLIINNVKAIEAGLYRYLPLKHKLVLIHQENNLLDKIDQACLNQKFIAKSAVVFAWTVIPYRTEWRYDILGHKIIALDAGHLCQNLYLASESIGAGSCAIGAYNQQMMDQILRVDGEEEFTIYLSAVGKI